MRTEGERNVFPMEPLNYTQGAVAKSKISPLKVSLQ